MAYLRTAMDSGFWDLNVSSPQTFGGSAKAVPGDPFPLDGTRASRALRIQQVSILGSGFPLGIIPSFSPTSSKEHGSFALQSLFFQPATSNWWLGLIGQFRPKKLISDIKGELLSGEGLEVASFKEAARRILDKSLYSLGLFTQFSPTPSSSVMFSSEQHGEKKGRRNKVMLFHELPEHDISLEAAWPELFVDHKGQYWDVPESISLDLLSHISDSGFRYRLGLHRNTGNPKRVNSTNGEGEPPLALQPGISAKAAFSYENSRDFWRVKERKEDIKEKTDKGGWYWRPSYDVRLKEPHSAISGIIGGSLGAWFGGKDGSGTVGGISMTSKKKGPLNADIFGSICYTYQHGRFRKLYRDLTRIDARLDICSATAFAKRIFNGFKSSVQDRDSSVSLPRLNLIFQQQVVGPIVFRVDSRFSLDSFPGKSGPEDMIYSLNYSLRLLRSGKVVAWYSPKRKEGMIELRLFEF